jgi:transcriptional regulator with XRE-family HTH domain
MPADHSALGAKIKKRRQALGIKSQQQLADMLGVNRTAVSDWESGKHYPVRYLGALEEVLGISLDDPADDMLPGPATREELRAAMRVLEEAFSRSEGNGRPKSA